MVGGDDLLGPAFLEQTGILGSKARRDGGAESSQVRVRARDVAKDSDLDAAPVLLCNRRRRQQADK
jgi:hypothetical protein